MDTYYEHPEYRPFFPNALNASHSIEIMDFDGLALLIQMTDEAVESPQRPDKANLLPWLCGTLGSIIWRKMTPMSASRW